MEDTSRRQDVTSVAPNGLGALARRMPYSGELTLSLAGVRLRLDCRHIHERRYLLNLVCGLPYPQGDIDRFLLNLLVRPGDLCFDAGSNIGVTALQMLEAGARHVILFEPVPELARRLRGLADPRLTILELALGADAGRPRMSLSVAHNQGHTLKAEIIGLFPAVFGDMPPSIEVRQESLDRLTRLRWNLTRRIPERAAIWKVDVEGAELDLLRGARDLLRRCPPRAILCESYADPTPLRDELGPAWQCLRAIIRRQPYGLALVAPEAMPDEALQHNVAPTFLFLHREALDPTLGAALDALRWDQRG